jgi:hypothetical protein
MNGLWRLVRRFLIFVSCKRKIQARCKNIVKFIESEGKAPSEKALGSSQLA